MRLGCSQRGSGRQCSCLRRRRRTRTAWPGCLLGQHHACAPQPNVLCPPLGWKEKPPPPPNAAPCQPLPRIALHVHILGLSVRLGPRPTADARDDESGHVTSVELSTHTARDFFSAGSPCREILVGKACRAEMRFLCGAEQTRAARRSAEMLPRSISGAAVCMCTSGTGMC